MATADVVTLHDQMRRFSGGREGFPHPEYLESALAAPKQTFAYDESCDLFDVAAVYLYHVAKAHAFADANKRTAYATTLVFLAGNGVFLFQPRNYTAIADLAVQAVDNEIDKPAIAAQLRRMAAAERPRDWRSVIPESQRRERGPVHLRSRR